jgi:methionyl-tRNA formyltransferase
MYMGTPEFAVPALDALARLGADGGTSAAKLVSVVTQPDRPRGRGHRLVPSPVKARAMELGLPVFQPESLKGDAEWEKTLADAAPDLIVVCAYGRILPVETLHTPRLGCVNIHASLLPKYRGAAPIHRAVESGERETGVTLMYMSEGLDEGDMIAARAMPILGMDTGEVSGALSSLGAELLMGELDRIITGTAVREPQASAAATYAPPVQRGEGHIDFSADAASVCRKVLAMTPSPGAFAFLDGEKLRVWQAEVGSPECRESYSNNGKFSKPSDCEVSQEAPDCEAAHEAPGSHPAPGTVTGTDGGAVTVATGSGGSVRLTKLQSPGGKAMAAADWLRGHSIEDGTVFA